ncbi:MAG: DUF4325 domain-containing protein [Candidatus Thermoplasmatota archaeon]
MSSVISEDLMMRASAAELFDMIERLPGDAVEVDFDGVKSCTWSFADEYDRHKLKSSKRVVEVNMSSFVRTLFMAVTNPNKKKDPVFDMDKLKVTVL